MYVCVYMRLISIAPPYINRALLYRLETLEEETTQLRFQAAENRHNMNRISYLFLCFAYSTRRLETLCISLLRVFNT